MTKRIRPLGIGITALLAGAVAVDGVALAPERASIEYHSKLLQDFGVVYVQPQNTAHSPPPIHIASPTQLSPDSIQGLYPASVRY